MKDILRYLLILKERRGLFLITAILMSLLFIGGSYLLPKKFRADSTVFIEKSVINNLVKGLAITPEVDDQLRVLKYALLSRGLITQVLQDLDMDTIHTDEADLQALVSDLQQRTSIQVKGKELFKVSITDSDPKFAQNYINTLVNSYVEGNLSGKREETYGANRFLNDQLTHFKKKLDEAEDAIIAFRKEKGIFLSQDDSGNLADLKAYQKQIEEIGITLNTLKAKKKKLTAQLTQLEPTIAIFSEKQRDDRIKYLDATLQTMLLTYTENYPDVIQLKSELESLRKRAAQPVEEGSFSDEMMVANPVYQDVQQKMLDLDAEIGALSSQRKSLEDILEQRKSALQNVPLNQKQLAVLSQERDSYRKIYQELLLRLGQAEVSKQMEISDKTTTFRIVDPAYLPIWPVFPNMPRMILMSIVAGIGVGAGLVLLLEQMKGSLRSVEDLVLSGLPVIGVIPVIVDSAAKVAVRRKDFALIALTIVYCGGVMSLLVFELILKGN